METFDPKMKELLTKRIEQRYKEGRTTGIYTLDGRYYTPEEQIEEIKTGSPVADELLFAEKKLMEELKRRM